MAVRVIGLDKALRDIESKGKDAVQAVVEVLSDTASAIDFDAKNAVPLEIDASLKQDGSKMVRISTKQRIDKDPSNKGLNWKIGIAQGTDFDAYVEFGTGQSAREILYGPGYTDEMRAIARPFKKKKDGTLKGKPFLMPAWIKNTSNLVEEIKSKIAQAVK